LRVPISVEWNPREELWTLTTGESFTLGEVADVVRETDWGGCKRFLWDLRQLQSGPDSSTDIQHAVDIVKGSEQTWFGSRAAIVVGRELDFGIARMFQIYAEGASIEYRVFRELDSAVSWLLDPSH
jgi:hypothetical protein